MKAAAEIPLPPPPVFGVPPPPDMWCLGLVEEGSVAGGGGPSCSAAAALDGAEGRAVLTSALVVSVALALVTVTNVLCLLWRRRRAKHERELEERAKAPSQVTAPRGGDASHGAYPTDLRAHILAASGSQSGGTKLAGGHTFAGGRPVGLLVKVAQPCHAAGESNQAEIYYSTSHTYNTIEPMAGTGDRCKARAAAADSCLSVYDNLGATCSVRSDATTSSGCGAGGCCTASRSARDCRCGCSAVGGGPSTDRTYDSTRSSLSSGGCVYHHHHQAQHHTPAVPPQGGTTILDQMWRTTQRGGGGSGAGAATNNDSGVSESGGTSSQQASPWSGHRSATCCREARCGPVTSECCTCSCRHRHRSSPASSENSSCCAGSCRRHAHSSCRGRDSPIYAEPYEDVEIGGGGGGASGYGDFGNRGGGKDRSIGVGGGCGTRRHTGNQTLAVDCNAATPVLCKHLNHLRHYGNNLHDAGSRGTPATTTPKDTVVVHRDPNCLSSYNAWNAYGTLGQTAVQAKTGSIPASSTIGKDTTDAVYI